MGLFGLGGDRPTLTLPDAPEFKTADELLQSGIEFGKAETPLALGAREGALADIGTGAAATQFFSEFGPTSFEEALANQQFQLATTESDRAIKQALSLSGIESSPILAEQLGRSRERLGVDIGSILANLGQRRGELSLQSRLNIDPISQIIGPISSFQQGQDVLQTQSDFDRAVAQAGLEFQNDLANFAQKEKLAAAIGATFGPGIGGAVGGKTGATAGFDTLSQIMKAAAGAGGGAPGSSVGAPSGGASTQNVFAQPAGAGQTQFVF
jgi:hypothetical protein